MTGADSYNTDHWPPIKQRQSPKVSVVRQDDPSETVRLIREFTVGTSMPSLFFDIKNAKPSGAQDATTSGWIFSSVSHRQSESLTLGAQPTE